MNFQTYLAFAVAGILGGLVAEAPFLMFIGGAVLIYGLAEAIVGDDEEEDTQ